MVTKEKQEEMVSDMREWLEVENNFADLTSKLTGRTQSPIVRLIKEIIHCDSLIHQRIEEWIATSMENGIVSLTLDELLEVWDLIEYHMELEKDVLETDEQASVCSKEMCDIARARFENDAQDDKKPEIPLMTHQDIVRRTYPYN